MKMLDNILEEIGKDDLYRSLFSDKDSISIRGTLSVAEQISKLSEGLEILSLELQSQVRQEHGALLSQASHAGRLYSALNTVSAHTDRLQGGAHRLRSQVNSQLAAIENQTKVLRRLHSVCHILRLCGRLLQMSRKLKSTQEPTQQAALLYELEFITNDTDLNKLEFVKEERSYVIAFRQRLNNFAQMGLVNGLKNGDKLKVTNSLQIFANLQTINKCIENILETFLNELAHSIKECYSGTDVTTLSSGRLSQGDANKDASKPSGSTLRNPGKAPNLTTTQNFRSKVWKALHWLIYDEFCDYCKQIALLESCLKDINQGAGLLSVSNEETNVLERFWQRLENLLSASFTECSPHIGQCLQEGLPKLLSAARGLEMKLLSIVSFSDKTFESLEAGYLEKCGSNLKSSLIGTDCPTMESVDGLVRSATTELSAAMVDNRLSLLVGNAFSACNKDFWTKIEANIKFGTDSKQVVDIPNTVQTQNIKLANLIYYHSDSVKRMIYNLGEIFSSSVAAKEIEKNLSYGRNLVMKIIQQLTDSMTTTLGIILLSMHREPGLNGDKISPSGPSLYMKELQDFLQRCWTLHISPFDDKESVQECGELLAAKCIDLFVHNVAILRPLSPTGRSRLKNDCSHLEGALKIIVNNLSALGKPFRLLRAVSTLITQPPEKLVEIDIEPEAPVPCYIILFLLFTHGKNELQSPHSAANWSNERLIQWLSEKNSLKDRLELVAGALQRYRATIRQKNITQYDPVYPLISSYFEKAYKQMVSNDL